MVAVPSPIVGSVGSRIRLVFGDDADEWLLLLDHDNGDTKWQVKDWAGIPPAVAKQLNNCTEKGRDIKNVDFGPSGAWYINGVKRDGSGAHSWWGNVEEASGTIKEWTSSPHSLQASFGTSSYGALTHALVQGDNGYSLSGNLHGDLQKRVERIHKRSKKINFTRLFDDGQFFIKDDEGMEWLLHNVHIADEIKKKGVIEEVAVAGDGTWVVIRENNFVSSVGFDKKLQAKLSKFFSDQRRWISERREEIADTVAANMRETRAREQAAREAEEAAALAAREAEEAAQCVERERIQQAAREAERAERERREEAERAEAERIEEAERAERERREEAERAANASAAVRISSLEATLERRLAEEAKDIRETEANLLRRKRSFRDAMSSMPAETRSRISIGDDGSLGGAESTGGDAACVVCQDAVAVMAVVPCGHVCLCNACSDACIGGRTARQACPLCRGNMQSVLRVYTAK